MKLALMVIPASLLHAIALEMDSFHLLVASIGMAYAGIGGLIVAVVREW